MHFRHVLAKIYPKNLKQHFDWGRGAGPWSSRLRPCFLYLYSHKNFSNQRIKILRIYLFAIFFLAPLLLLNKHFYSLFFKQKINYVFYLNTIDFEIEIGFKWNRQSGLIILDNSYNYKDH